MDTLELRLFGGFNARVGGEAVIIPTNKAKALLVLLVLSRGKPRARDELMSLLWSDRSEEQARASLRQELAVLRKCLGADLSHAIRVESDSVTLDPTVVRSDVIDFEVSGSREDGEADYPRGARGHPSTPRPETRPRHRWQHTRSYSH